MQHADPTKTPVFLHSAWRTASTYVWAKLGRSPGNLGFCEPYNEVLSHLGVESIQTLRSDGWGSGHPSLEQPYFAEYTGIAHDPGGIEQFQTKFSYADYYELDPAAVAPQKAYLQNIVDFAERQGGRPVLGFCRTLGRLPWLTRAFPDVLHVELRRDAVSQFLSSYYQWVRRDNPYFLVGYVTIAGLATGSPYLAGVCDLLGIPWAPSREPVEAFAFYRAWMERQRPELLFEVFWHVHTLSTYQSRGLCDLVLDVDQLSLSADYQSTLEKQLGEYGFDVSFADATVPSYAGDDMLPRLEIARRRAESYTETWRRNGAAIAVPH